MIVSTTGVVYAAEGSVVLDVVPPPRTLAEAMAARGHDEAREFNEILFETGINRGPVELQVEASKLGRLFRRRFPKVDSDRPGYLALPRLAPRRRLT
jgi:hypothetical protein